VAHARSLVLDKHSGADAYSIIEGFLQVTEIGSLKKLLKKRAAGGAGASNSRWIMRSSRDVHSNGHGHLHQQASTHSVGSAYSSSTSQRRDPHMAAAAGGQSGRDGPGDGDAVSISPDADELHGYQAQSYQAGGALDPGTRPPATPAPPHPGC
jgi:hypothetical protein